MTHETSTFYFHKMSTCHLNKPWVFLSTMRMSIFCWMSNEYCLLPHKELNEYCLLLRKKLLDDPTIVSVLVFPIPITIEQWYCILLTLLCLTRKCLHDPIVASILAFSGALTRKYQHYIAITSFCITRKVLGVDRFIGEKKCLHTAFPCT